MVSSFPEIASLRVRQSALLRDSHNRKVPVLSSQIRPTILAPSQVGISHCLPLVLEMEQENDVFIIVQTSFLKRIKVCKGPSLIKLYFWWRIYSPEGSQL